MYFPAYFAVRSAQDLKFWPMGYKQIWYIQVSRRVLKGLDMLFLFFFPPGRNADVMVRLGAAFMGQEVEPCIEDGRAEDRWNWGP